MHTVDLARQLQHGDYTTTILPDGSGVLLDLQHEALLSFNATGAFMLSCLMEGLGQAEIVRKVVGKFDVDEATAATDVAGFITQLADAVGGQG